MKKETFEQLMKDIQQHLDIVKESTLSAEQKIYQKILTIRSLVTICGLGRIRTGDFF